VTHYSESNYYELLDVEPAASPAEIDEAYKRQMELLSGASLATYGLFVGDDLVLARQRVEDAYRVLRDPERRRAYDDSGYAHPPPEPEAPAPPAEAVAEGPAQALAEAVGEAPAEARGESLWAAEAFAGATPPPETPAAEAPDAPGVSGSPAPAAPAASAPHAPPAGAGPEAIPTDGSAALAAYDGASMRAERERRGITLAAISAQTRIAEYYLDYIEDERYDTLPPVIYLRSYVRQYAAAVGLDADRAVEGYLARYNEIKGRT
jgi:curved DNA-binding protein CbpA